MTNDLVNSFDFSKGVNHFEFNTAQGNAAMNHDQKVWFLLLEMLYSN